MKGYEIIPVNNYSGIKIDVPVVGEIDLPLKVRVSGRFIPDFIFDPTQPSPEAGLIASIIQPEVYVQIGKRVYKINYKGEMSEATLEEFYRPTFFDEWRNMDPILKTIILSIVGFSVFKIIKCIL